MRMISSRDLSVRLIMRKMIHSASKLPEMERCFSHLKIRPLSEEEYNKCKKKHTKYVRNKQFGMKLPEETNTVKFRDALIYTATVEADREKLWDNKKVWESLRAKDLQIMNGLDVIEYCLKAGEKDKIIECIDSLSGFEENIEEVAKNS